MVDRWFLSLPLAEQLRVYEDHNPGALDSSDVNKRLYGSCGCGSCRSFRSTQRFDAMAMNKPGRKTNKMGSINVCDRCGALVKGGALGAIEITTSSEYKTKETHSQEICPACVGDFMLMWETVVGERERAYGTPYQPAKDEDSMDGATAEQLAAKLLEKVMTERRAIEGTIVDHE